MSAFTPIETQEHLDTIIKTRVARLHAQLDEARQDASTWKRDSRLWEQRAKRNLAVIKAHEGTISKFIVKLDDVLNEDEGETP